ncbi:hypothetical protein [Pyruvatibacter mobilis]|uniref:hypothetical protein n=1 Tax=Pyruvatibacter mobilis TaxID=1712261 RepID=UPI003BB00FE5
MTFHVGQKVVCVDDRPIGADVKHLNRGSVYTVAQVLEFDHPARGRYVGVHLTEVRRPAASFGVVVPWNTRRFRPAVQPRKELPEEITQYLNVPGRVDA